MACVQIIVLTILAMSALASITDPKLLPTPPMGFNNWSRFECNLNDTLFRTIADALVSTGLQSAGYNRLNLDDCWMEKKRRPDGTLHWNSTLFPRGIHGLAQYVKSRGFHFGIYQNAGNMTCGGYPGSYGYEELDAKTYESWGVDFLKLDGCNVFSEKGQTLQQKYREIYGKWHQVLTNLTKPLIFSESAPAYFSGDSFFPKQKSFTNWYRVMSWAPLYGELARHSNDIAVYGEYDPPEYWKSIMNNYHFNLKLARYQQPGFYNDPDFILADYKWLTLTEKRSQFTLWASFSAPLLISAYVPHLTPKEIAIYTNKEVIAVNQDKLGLQATLASRDDTFDVLTKNLANGDRLVTILNKSNMTAETGVAIERMGFSGGRAYDARNLWDGSVTRVTEELRVSLPAHGTEIYRFFDVPAAYPTGIIFNSASGKCLTGTDMDGIVFYNCTSRDAQIWRISTRGSVATLSEIDSCITEDSSGLTLRSCSTNDNGQRWVYDISGNVRHYTSNKCLTQKGTRAVFEPCGDLLDSQIFGLPSGVVIERPPAPNVYNLETSLQAETPLGLA